MTEPESQTPNVLPEDQEPALRRLYRRLCAPLRWGVDILYLVWDSVAVNLLKTDRISRRLGRSCQWLFNIQGYPFCIPSLKYRHPRLFRAICKDILDEHSPEGFCLCGAEARFPRIYPLRSALVLLVFLAVIAGVGLGIVLKARQVIVRGELSVAARKREADELAARADEKIKAEKWEEARIDLLNALDIDPECVPALIGLGDYFDHRNAPGAASKYLGSAERLDPRNVEALQKLALIYMRFDLMEKASGYARRALTVSPDIAPCHLVLALNALSERDLEGAQKNLAAADKLAPRTDLGNLVAGKIAFVAGDMEKARQLFSAVIEAGSKHYASKARLDLASVVFRLKDASKAEELLEKVIKDTDALEAKGRLVTLYLVQGQTELAVLRAQKVAATHHNELLARVRMAQTLLAFKLTDPALEIVLDGLRRWPRDVPLNLMAAECYLRHSIPTVAQAHCERVAAVKPADPRAEILMARADWQLGQQDRAIERLTRLAGQMDTPEDVYEWLTRFYFARKKPAEVIPVLEQGAKVSPSSGRIRALLGRALKAAGKSQEAEPALREAIKLDPSLYEAYAALGTMAEAAGNTKKAIELYQKAVDVGRREAWGAANNLAVLLLREKRDPKRALALAYMAYKSAPNRVETLDTLAQALMANGDLKNATAVIEEAMRRIPNNPYLYLTAARVEYARGDKSLARSYLEKALAAQKDFPLAKDARQMLRHLDQSPEAGPPKPAQPPKR